MSMKVVLYYSNNCSYCKQFKPTWEALKTTLSTSGIEFKEYEASQNNQIMKTKNIKGYPTLRIETNEGEYEYSGSRTPETIMENIAAIKGDKQINDFVAPVSENSPFSDLEPIELATSNKHTMNGGGDPYYEKYKKYKAKYTNLKKWMDKNN